MNLSKVLFAVVVTMVFLLGCSSSTQNPVSPAVDEESVNQLTASATETPLGQAYLWGYYELGFDVETRTIEATPVRSSEFTANVVGFLNNDPQGLKVKINGSTPGAGGRVEDIVFPQRAGRESQQSLVVCCNHASRANPDQPAAPGLA